jgi:L-threonylcarbamoyladenylate synthase
MITKVITVDAVSPETEKIAEAAGIIRAGGIACLPMETVFGLACNGDNKAAVRRLYEIKKRPGHKRFVIQVSDINQVIAYQACIRPDARVILDRFWPGPLTVIFDTKRGKTGFRMPDNQTALAIIRASDFPLVVTSANISGEKSLLSAIDASLVFNGLVDVIVDDKTRAKGVASTVVDCTQSTLRILREGPIARELYKSFRVTGKR